MDIEITQLQYEDEVALSCKYFLALNEFFVYNIILFN